MKENLQRDIEVLRRQVEELGAESVAISARNIVVDERVPFKCQVPRCAFYNFNLTCPPNIMTPREFKGLLKKYHRGIIIKVQIETHDFSGEQPNNLNTAWENINKTSPITIPEANNNYLYSLKNGQTRLYDILEKIEAKCVQMGYHFAAGLAAGGCSLCEVCVGIGSGTMCPHPFKARPSIEGLGIDVLATTKKVGLNINFSAEGTRSWVGMVLVD